jgi:outer membrane protein TolC
MSSPLFSRPVARTAGARTSARLACVVILGALLPVAHSLAQTPALSLPEARRLAVERSRQLAGQDAAIDATRQAAVAAGQLPDPVLRLGIDNLPISGPDRFSLSNDFMTMRRVGLMQELTRSDKRQARSARGERGAERQVAEKAVLASAIGRDTTLAWLELYYATEMAQVLTQQRAQVALELAAAEGAYRGGRGSQADLFAARGVAAMLDDRSREIDRRARNAATMLTRWIGPLAPLTLAGTPPIEQVGVDPARIEALLAQQPEAAMWQGQERLAEAEVALATANLKPDWSVEVAYQQRGAAYSNMLSVGLSVPLQWDRKQRQDRELSAKMALLEQARAERDELLRARAAEARTLLGEWETGRERIEHHRRDLMPLAAERSAALLAAYRGGKASLSDLLAARRNELDVRLQTLQLEADTARFWATLSYLFPNSTSPAHSAPNTHKDSQ